jgi:NDP-sugar pyrophosphorylase family protein
VPSLVIMAAGLGSRFGGLKQLAPVGPQGEAILDYSAYDAVASGFDHVVLVVRSEIEPEVRRHIDGRWPPALRVDLVCQDKEPSVVGLARQKPLGTAHAVLSTRTVVDGPFAVVNADDLYGPGCYRLILDHFGSGEGGEHALVGFRLGDTVAAGSGPVMRGLCEQDDDGHLVTITETLISGSLACVSADMLVSMNVWAFQPDIFDGLAEAVTAFLAAGQGAGDAEVLLPTVVGDLIAHGRAVVRVLPATDRWVGLTYATDLGGARALVAELIDAGVEPLSVWS